MSRSLLSQEAEQRLRTTMDAATAGPWIDRWDRITDDAKSVGPGDLQRVIVTDGDADDLSTTVVGLLGTNGVDVVIGANDAAFVVEARNTLPALFAELDRLRAREKKLEDGVRFSLNTVDLLAEEIRESIGEEEWEEGNEEMQWVRDLVGHERET